MEGLNNLPPSQEGPHGHVERKALAMSAGRKWWKELYVGFLLFLLSFLYLSQLITEIRAGHPAGRLSLDEPAALVSSADAAMDAEALL